MYSFLESSFFLMFVSNYLKWTKLAVPSAGSLCECLQQVCLTPTKAVCSGILFNSLTVWQGLEYLNHFPLPPKMHWQGAGAPTPLQPEMQSSELQLNQPHHNVHLSPLILDSSKFHMHLLQSLAPLPLLSR